MIQYIETVHIRLTIENQNLMGKLHGTPHIIVIKGFWKGLWHNFLKCNSGSSIWFIYKTVVEFQEQTSFSWEWFDCFFMFHRVIQNMKNTWAKELVHTLYNVILRIARNFLETRENVKISTHPFYHTNLDWFSWEWSKRKLFFSKKTRLKRIESKIAR